MALEMRDLQGDDLFTLLAIVGKLDIKDELLSLFGGGEQEPLPTDLTDEQREAEIEKRGMKIVANLLQNILMNLGKVKGDINAFLADLTGVSVNEVQTLNLAEYTKLLKDFFTKKDLTDFFASIASLME